jgi:hypothetical protein
MSEQTLQARFSIGDTFKTRGRHPRLCTILDILRTYNSNGELVRVRYVASHKLNGQVIMDYDVCETSVLMGKL